MTKLSEKIRMPKLRSLRLRMLLALVVGAALAFSAFLSVRAVGNGLVNSIYLSESEREKRELAYVSELQGYIERNELRSVDVEELAEWARGYKYLYVMVHRDDQLLFESPDYDPNNQPVEPEEPEEPDHGEGNPNEGEGSALGDAGDPLIKDKPTREELIKFAEERGAHVLTMKDGNVFVSMAEFTEYLYYNIVNIVSLSIAFVVLVMVMLIYFSGLTRRISLLAGAVTKVADGNITEGIESQGSDELAELSRDVENMRSSLVDSIAKEREAMKANTELITAMSHDVRTPLTVLLGYIDLMRTAADEKTMREYIDASESMALRLKEMSDDMFNYFLVFGQSEDQIANEECDVLMLLEQVLSEYTLLLKDQGFTIESDTKLGNEGASPSLIISTDTGKLVRLLGNLASNLMKYADKAAPVSFFASIDGSALTLRISNGISSGASRGESNGIGLKTCHKLAELLGMSFSAVEEKKRFVTELVIPINER